MRAYIQVLGVVLAVITTNSAADLNKHRAPGLGSKFAGLKVFCLNV